MLSREAIFDGLNDSQAKVVSSIDGKYLVLAGAGSGKTHTLGRRVCNLLEIGVNARNITAISFTKKASNEIKDRIFSMAGSMAMGLHTGTFHSLCMKILLPNQDALKRHGLIGVDTITIIDEADVIKIITSYANLYGYTGDEEVKEVISAINFWSNRNYEPEHPDVIGKTGYKEIYQEFIEYKKRVGYLDFNDILGMTLNLLKRDNDILEQYSRQFKYMIVDECQDLNNVQFELLMKLSSHHGNFMLIGDDLQCIYSFRGSNVNNMMNIRDIDPEVETLLLERNYRSTATIVNASNDVIKHNINQLEKISFTEQDGGDPIFAYVSDDESKEADFITDVIDGYVSNGLYDYKDFAVIYRSAWSGRQTELALGKAGIPFDVNNGTNFYDRAEIKALASYLRCVQNPFDDVALENIINVPKRGVGDATVDKLRMYATENNLSLYLALKHISDIPRVRKNTVQAVDSLVEILEELKAYARENRENLSMHYLLNMVVRKTGFLDQYSEEKLEDEKRIDNIAELSTIALSFDREIADLEDYEQRDKLTEFISTTTLFDTSNEDEEVDDNKVKLTTVHSAKGLEFPVVFVVGLEEGTFPSSRVETPEEIEEERRLFYVAMTRAKKTLFLSFNQNRIIKAEVKKQVASRFLSEVPKHYIKILGWEPQPALS